MLKNAFNFIIFLFFSCHASWALASAQNSEASLAKMDAAEIGSSVTQPSEYFGQIILSLVLVLLIVFIAAWLLRRYGRFPGVAEGNLKVLGALSVGQRERILLLQVGKDQVLVGVTSSKITRLHQLDEPVDMSATEGANSNAGMAGAFSQKLQEALNPQKNKDNKTE